MSEDIKEMICIVCPQGCKLQVRYNSKTNDYYISNHKCDRGPVYAKKELINPTRFLTATVKIEEGFHQRLPVKSSKEIPKGLITDVMQIIDKVTARAPIKLGEKVIENILDTGIDIVATRSMSMK